MHHLASGSSPLTRGAPQGHPCCLPPIRLIPAHAGSTVPHSNTLPTAAAHPRSRGEHFRIDWPVFIAAGSSPLTRGARLRLYRRVFTCGLIPAHAGSTAMPNRLAKSSRAHPRSRGEHARIRTHETTREGSSPLTRGALRRAYSASYKPRLIPAHAGSTPADRWGHAFARAHPRSRGEHY